jgi:hypothetical protein
VYRPCDGPWAASQWWWMERWPCQHLGTEVEVEVEVEVVEVEVEVVEETSLSLVVVGLHSQ